MRDIEIGVIVRVIVTDRQNNSPGKTDMVLAIEQGVLIPSAID